MSKIAKAPLRAPFLTRTVRPADLPEHFLLVRQAPAGKLGLRAHGNITYQVLLDPKRTRVFLRVVANSGSGSFSDEPVLVNKLAEAVASHDPGKPLRGSALASAIIGKSVCNVGFFAAVLVAERLLGRDPSKRFDLLDLERWQAWTAEQLATPGELDEVCLKSDAVTQHKHDTAVDANSDAHGTTDETSTVDGESGGTGGTGGDPKVAPDHAEIHPSKAHRRGKGRE